MENKIVTGMNFIDLIQSGGYAVGELGIVIPSTQSKTISTTACMCHMLREMGDCRLDEVVKQVIKNKL